MHPAVRISTSAKVVLNNEILAEPGSLSATVHLQGTADHRSATILFMGTNRFAAPFDSTGRFSVEMLAPGFYRLRIFATDRDFAVVETTVTVSSGIRTVLPTIELKKVFIPTVEGFSVSFNAAMMTVELKWMLSDTGSVSGYNIYLNRPLNLKPIATVANTCSLLTLDIIESTLDTFVYQISAVAKSGIEGTSVAGEPFVNTSPFKLIKKIDFHDYGERFYVDRHENILIVNDRTIWKLDSNGLETAAYHLPDTGGELFIHSLQTDERGNVFMINETWGPAGSIFIRFDSDLNRSAELIIQREGVSFAPFGNGSSFFISNHLSDSGYFISSTITKYDSNFVIISKRELLRNLCFQHSFFNNDTLFCIVSKGFDSTLYVHCYDTSFNLLASSKVPLIVNDFSTFSSRGRITIKTMIRRENTAPILHFFDLQQQQVARFLCNSISADAVIDHKCNFYVMEGTINKYSSELLYQKETP